MVTLVHGKGSNVVGDVNTDPIVVHCYVKKMLTNPNQPNPQGSMFIDPWICSRNRSADGAAMWESFFFMGGLPQANALPHAGTSDFLTVAQLHMEEGAPGWPQRSYAHPEEERRSKVHATHH